ncbi:hypothetical protein ABPG72_008192 [Tetrahymena utriculariae]
MKFVVKIANDNQNQLNNSLLKLNEDNELPQLLNLFCTIDKYIVNRYLQQINKQEKPNLSSLAQNEMIDNPPLFSIDLHDVIENSGNEQAFLEKLYNLLKAFQKNISVAKEQDLDKIKEELTIIDCKIKYLQENEETINQFGYYKYEITKICLESGKFLDQKCKYEKYLKQYSDDHKENFQAISKSDQSGLNLENLLKTFFQNISAAKEKDLAKIMEELKLIGSKIYSLEEKQETINQFGYQKQELAKICIESDKFPDQKFRFEKYLNQYSRDNQQHSFNHSSILNNLNIKQQPHFSCNAECNQEFSQIISTQISMNQNESILTLKTQNQIEQYLKEEEVEEEQMIDIFSNIEDDIQEEEKQKNNYLLYIRKIQSTTTQFLEKQELEKLEDLAEINLSQEICFQQIGLSKSKEQNYEQKPEENIQKLEQLSSFLYYLTQKGIQADKQFTYFSMIIQKLQFLPIISYILTAEYLLTPLRMGYNVYQLVKGYMFKLQFYLNTTANLSGLLFLGALLAMPGIGQIVCLAFGSLMYFAYGVSACMYTSAQTFDSTIGICFQKIMNETKPNQQLNYYEIAQSKSEKKRKEQSSKVEFDENEKKILENHQKQQKKFIDEIPSKIAYEEQVKLDGGIFRFDGRFEILFNSQSQNSQQFMKLRQINIIFNCQDNELTELLNASCMMNKYIENRYLSQVNEKDQPNLTSLAQNEVLENQLQYSIGLHDLAIQFQEEKDFVQLVEKELRQKLETLLNVEQEKDIEKQNVLRYTIENKVSLLNNSEINY